jgi:hypothetical protein
VLAFTAAFLLVERVTADVICLFKSEQISGAHPPSRPVAS